MPGMFDCGHKDIGIGFSRWATRGGRPYNLVFLGVRCGRPPRVARNAWCFRAFPWCPFRGFRGLPCFRDSAPFHLLAIVEFPG
jgi:hypothetical protein